MMEKYQVLEKYFGYTEFREGQETLVDSILSGRDAVGIMPTGAGKSLCFQLPALLLDGVALVVSPLISLMKDQVNALTQAGIPAAYINSSLTPSQFRRALDNARAGEYKILYIAPERLLTEEFLSFARTCEISLVSVDAVSYTHLDVYKRQAQTGLGERVPRRARKPAHPVQPRQLYRPGRLRHAGVH